MKNLLLLLSVCISHSAFCQNIGIGTPAPKNKLHIAGGLRVDTLANGIDSGLLRHDKNGVVYSLKFTGSASDVLRGNGTFGSGAAASGWSLSGNSGTNPASNFIGTTDNQPLRFRVNNEPAGILDPINNNTLLGLSAVYKNTGLENAAFGYQALNSNTIGSNNTAMGSNSLLYNITGNNNTASGTFALNTNQGGSNGVAIGAYSQLNVYPGVNGWDNTNTSVGYRSLQGSDVPTANSGAFNTAIGRETLYSNYSGSDNTACGIKSLYSNSDGDDNVAIGAVTLYTNTSGSKNTANGNRALHLNQAGSYNTANGFEALYSNLGSSNVASGFRALYSNTLGGGNSAMGAGSLTTNHTGNSNTALGYEADVLIDGLSHATAIGANAKVGSSNSLVLGGAGADAVKVGIGVTSPIVTLHVKGTANFFSGADTHTGDFYAGTSNVDGIEMVSSGADAYMSVQRTGGGYGLHVTKKNTLNNNGLIGFLVNDILVGAITTNGTTTTYYSSPSDARLKENIHPTQFGLSNLMKINVADYNYKADNAKKLQTGFIAQDLYKLYPQAVQTGGESEKTNPWMIDYSKITPLLVKSIQQQQQIIENQKSEIDILKTQVENLINAVNTLTHK